MIKPLCDDIKPDSEFDPLLISPCFAKTMGTEISSEIYGICPFFYQGMKCLNTYRSIAALPTLKKIMLILFVFAIGQVRIQGFADSLINNDYVLFPGLGFNDLVDLTRSKITNVPYFYLEKVTGPYSIIDPKGEK